MKHKISEIRQLSSAFDSLKDRTVNATGEVIKGVVIPPEKIKTGYWIGRLEEKASKVFKSSEKQRVALVKELGEEIKIEDKPTGQFKVKPENADVYNKSLEELFESEEEITFTPIDVELLNCVQLPAEFWSAITPFITEPK